MALRARILHDVHEERLRQDIKWGGADHDAHHTPEEWRRLIKDRCDRLPLSPADDRRLFVEIAAIAAAAIEAHDLRQEAPPGLLLAPHDAVASGTDAAKEGK